MSNMLGRSVIHALLIASLGLLIYSNTLNVPFQFDEFPCIKDNPVVKDMSYFIHPAGAKGFGPLYNSLRDRYMGYLTFALNYKFHGLDVRGYHVVNIALHILNSLLVYALVRLTLRTPFLSGSSLGRHSGAVALFAGLLFVAHPVQTEAVNYIMGRLPLVVSFFYLGSVALYLKWRLTPLTLNPSPTGRGQGVRVILYSLSLLSAVLAMKSKENAFTLPLMIMLFEFSFFRGQGTLGRRMLYLSPFLLTMSIIPLSLTGAGWHPAGMESFEFATRHYSTESRWEYFITQIPAMAKYIRLLFVPVSQNFAYGLISFGSFFDSRVLLSALLILAVFGLAVYLFFRSAATPPLRLISAGVLWFFATLSVESSLLPIPLVICEYRVYLPAAGAIIALVAGGFILSEKAGAEKAKLYAAAFFILVLIAFSAASHIRNRVWQSRIGLWEDVVSKSAKDPWAHYNLATIYATENRFREAFEHHLRGYTLLAGSKAPEILSLAFISQIKVGINYFEDDLRRNPPPDAENAEIHGLLERAYLALGRTDKAAEHRMKAEELKRKPD